MESGNNNNNCKCCPRIDQTDVWHTIIIRTSYQQEQRFQNGRWSW